MDMSAESLREALHRVDVEGWDSAAGRELLDHVRRAVVVPVVRRSGLRGPAADQAEASGWEAAWDALRRPTARTAQNPGGMVWVAVRRAVAGEADFARMLDGGTAGRVARGTAAADAGNPAEPRTPTGPCSDGCRRAPATHHHGRCHGRIARARVSPSTTSWTVGGSRPDRRRAQLRTSAPLLLRCSTASWPSVGIEQVPRTRS